MTDIDNFLSAYRTFTDFLSENSESRDIKVRTELRCREVNMDKAWARLSQEEKDLAMRKAIPETGVVIDTFSGHAVKIKRL